MRDHVKKCKETYHNFLEGSDAETGLYEPCFQKGDTHLLKEGLAPSMPFTYKLEEKRVNTKTIEQLILEFSAKAQEEVRAVPQAHALCKRQKAPAPDGDSKRSLYEAETDAEETPKKWTKSTPVSTTPTTTKPSPSAAVSRAPKGTSIDDDELDYDDDVENEDTGGGPSQTQEPPKDEKPQDSEKHSNPQHCSSQP